VFDAVWVAATLLTFSALFWGGSAIAGRMAADTVPPMGLTFWRWLLAFVILLPLGGPALWRSRDVAIRRWPWLAFLSVLGMSGFSVPYFYGLQTTTAVNAALLNALSPILTLALAVVVLRTRMSIPQIAGMLIGLVGAAVIVFHGRLDAIAALTVEIGDLLILVAMAVWAGYTVAIRWKPVDLDPMAFMLALSGFTIPIMIPFYALELAEGKTFVPDAKALGIIVYHGVCSSVLAYLCWNQGVAVIGSARASLAQYLIPVFGAVLAMIILGETLAWFHYAGIVTIFAGIAIASARR